MSLGSSLNKFSSSWVRKRKEQKLPYFEEASFTVPKLQDAAYVPLKKLCHFWKVSKHCAFNYLFPEGSYISGTSTNKILLLKCLSFNTLTACTRASNFMSCLRPYQRHLGRNWFALQETECLSRFQQVLFCWHIHPMLVD